MASVLGQALAESLTMWNHDNNGDAWTLGTNYSNVATQFETYVNKYLFPKIQQTRLINVLLGNRFNFLAKETPYIGQLNEEYVIMDSVPVDLNLDKEATLMLKRNYPKMATRLYAQGAHKKTKFTLNDNDNRLNWSTLGDAIGYAVAVYQKRISDINVSEETEIRAMLVDYALNQISDQNKIQCTDLDDLASRTVESILNLQNNSARYNEVAKASGGAVGRYTTATDIKDMMILTTDHVKAYLLDTKIANTFQVAGIDITNKIISFGDLGGAFKTNDDVTIAKDDIKLFDAMGDYQAAPGDVIPAGSVFTWDVTQLPSFSGKATEIKPDTNNFVMLLDVNALYYKRNTEKLLPKTFYNGDLDEYNYFMHYYSFKAISPFYNKLVLTAPQG